jgi:hypothetical protein
MPGIWAPKRDVMQTMESTAATPEGGAGRRRSMWIFGAALVALALVATAVWWFGVRGSDGDFEPVEVTGISVCSNFRCTDTMSDPRVSGDGIIDLEKWDRTTGELVGMHELANDGGSWVGPFTGVDDDATEAWAEAVLIGSGGYDGLQYRYRIEFGPSETSEHLMTGTIEAAP